MKKLDIKKLPREKVFFIGVKYYSGDVPCPIINENKSIVDNSDETYKIVIPYKKINNRK